MSHSNENLRFLLLISWSSIPMIASSSQKGSNLSGQNMSIICKMVHQTKRDPIFQDRICPSFLKWFWCDVSRDHPIHSIKRQRHCSHSHGLFQREWYYLNQYKKFKHMQKAEKISHALCRILVECWSRWRRHWPQANKNVLKVPQREPKLHICHYELKQVNYITITFVWRSQKKCSFNAYAWRRLGGG